MDVPFTQFLRPNGQPVRVTIDRPDDIARLARRLAAHGVRLETEVLTTGEVSFTAEREKDGETELLACEVVPNGPEVRDAVDRLVTAASAQMPVDERSVVGEM